MNVIIDVHSHILPGLDDGSSNMEESLEMLRMAYQQGVRQIIATPHYSGRFRDASPGRVRKLCEEVQEAARQQGMKIRIYPGQEIMYTDEAADLLREGKLLTMADSRYVLVEFFPSVTWSALQQAVRTLMMSGCVPVIAHAERYPCLRENGRIDALRDQGILIQLNYRSAGGNWHDRTTRWCRKMLKEKKADLLGTDMHNTGNRSPSTQSAVKWMEAHLTRLGMRKVMYRNAMKLIADEKI